MNKVKEFVSSVMLKKGTISYAYHPGSIYLNITNRCSNNCVFCVRNYTDELAGYYLWLSHEPGTKEIISSVKEELNTQVYEKPEEVIFCGYGEPFYRPHIIIEILEKLKILYPACSFRINTNGQSVLINNGRSFLPELAGLLDRISISLNAENGEIYREICRPVYGKEAFPAVLSFAKEAVRYIPEVTLTVVRGTVVDIEKCRGIAFSMGAGFRVR